MWLEARLLITRIVYQWKEQSSTPLSWALHVWNLGLSSLSAAAVLKLCGNQGKSALGQSLRCYPTGSFQLGLAHCQQILFQIF